MLYMLYMNINSQGLIEENMNIIRVFVLDKIL